MNQIAVEHNEVTMGTHRAAVVIWQQNDSCSMNCWRNPIVIGSILAVK